MSRSCRGYCDGLLKNRNSVIVITERIVRVCGDSKAAGAWAIPKALPSSPMRVPSFRDGIRWASKLKTPAKEIPSPTSESYLPNSAILLDAKSYRARSPWVRGKLRRVAANIAKLPELSRKP
jgi:hypothetical protein